MLRYLAIVCLLIHTTTASDYYNCNSSSNLPGNSSNYRSLRDSLLFSLPGEVKDQGGYYYGNTITFSSAPVPYCLGLCRKDLISSDACYNCITNSSSDIIRSCKTQMDAIAWGAEAGCIVRCFPHQLSQSYETQPAVHVCNATSIVQNDVGLFNHALANLTSRIAIRAADEGSSSFFPTGYNTPQYFATEETKFNDLQTIYALGFCLPSLSTDGCTACLQGAENGSNKYCKGKQGATILTPSCVLRYEVYSFYESTTFSGSSPPPLPSASPSSLVRKEGRNRRKLLTAVVLPLIVVLAVVIIIGVRNPMKKKNQRRAGREEAESMEPCLEFSLNTIREATNGFSSSNKLGRGGFGAVYKGTLPNGQLIAVKRLAHHTARGELEFKNEVRLLARLHHKNLIRLFGFALGLKERVLIYELALNGSLDRVLFDPMRREHLNWKTRSNIIEGTARGLLYLHEESQLRIIHRDLKASNVLLDEYMNPKISDFGTARLFYEDLGSASKIVGTFGYMAPEYAKYGKISVKIDVFSFGVLLLEIVSGKRNSTAGNAKQIDHLLSKTWKCWTDERLMELIDPILLREGNHAYEISRCIHIGLLCVQENSACRPSMNQVILMLEGCSQSLPTPLEPAYLMNISKSELNVLTLEDHTTSSRLKGFQPEPVRTNHYTSSSHGFSSSVNEFTFTSSYPEPR